MDQADQHFLTGKQAGVKRKDQMGGKVIPLAGLPGDSNLAPPGPMVTCSAWGHQLILNSYLGLTTLLTVLRPGQIAILCCTKVLVC